MFWRFYFQSHFYGNGVGVCVRLPTNFCLIFTLVRVFLFVIVSIYFLVLFNKQIKHKNGRPSSKSSESDGPTHCKFIILSQTCLLHISSRVSSRLSLQNLIFRYLQTRSRVSIWLYENINMKMEGHIVGFDEFMNIVLDDAEEVHLKTNTRKQIGQSFILFIMSPCSLFNFILLCCRSSAS